MLFSSDAKSPPKIPSSNCETAFLKYKEAGCVVYDDIKCDDKDFGIGLMPGARRSFDQNARVNDISFKNNIEAVSVQQGCSLQMWTGKWNFKFLHKVFKMKIIYFIFISIMLDFY